MRAFVLGAGSNLGPMQVGGLRALFENKIYPDILIGCSVGSLNASLMAQGFNEQNLQKLATLWGKIRRKDIYPGNRVGTLFRLLSGHTGLTNNRRYQEWLLENKAVHDKAFSQLPIPLYVTATNCHTKQLHTFGKRGQDRVIDAVMASTAVPPLHAPWQVDDDHYIDGGVITPLPLRIALELGASEIYALRVEHYQPQLGDREFNHGSIGVVQRSINTMIHSQAEHDLHLANTAKNVRLTYINLHGPKSLARHDFRHGKKLVERGYRLTCAQFNNQAAQVDEMGYRPPTIQQSFAATAQQIQSKLQRTVIGEVQAA